MDDVFALVNSIKTAADVLKSLMALSKSAPRQGVPNEFSKALDAKIVEMNGIILSAQSCALTAQAAQFALAESERELKAKIVELEN